MNSNLNQLQPYPFQKLQALFAELTTSTSYRRIDLHIGEPKHTTPAFIIQTLIDNIEGLARYPTTLGTQALRNSIAAWLMQRYNLPNINPDTEVIPVNGSREALFSFAQVVVDKSGVQPVVVCPNPFYQIYEGAALLAGAIPQFINTLVNNNFTLDYAQLSDKIWSHTQLIYVCSPSNPTGKVMSINEWQQLFALSDRYGFVIAADECYSEIYFNDKQPPLGALEAAHSLGRYGFPRLVVFGSLSKRSNVPGMRSGFVAGDATILKQFLLYRTYHGCAMNPAVQAASTVAWQNEAHVVENRRLYLEKLTEMVASLAETIPAPMPDAAFYLWVPTPISDVEFTQRLYQNYNVSALPGSFLARKIRGINPGKDFIRIALVASQAECREAINRIKNLAIELTG